MKKITITRDTFNKNGTFGELVMSENGNVIFRAQTLEPAGEPTTERNKNRPIPLGEYKVTYHDSPNFGRRLLHIYNKEVPSVRFILLHAGNTVKDTEGCVLVGEVRVSDGIRRSRAKLDELLALAGDDQVTLEIKNA